MTRTRLALALALAALTAPASLLVSPSPLAAQPGTSVNGQNVIGVRVAGGYFVKTGGNQWMETDLAEKPTFRFEETGRDEWSVYLNDPSRNVQIQIDLHRRKVSYGTDGGPRSDLYDIVQIYGPQPTVRPSPPPAPRPSPSPAPVVRPSPAPSYQYSAPQQRTRMVNAGPIWDQRDAQLKCPVAAHAVGGRWTGQWRTVRNGEMSVCEIAQ